MTKEMAREKEREIAMSNIERQTPNHQTHTFFPQRTCKMQVNKRLARSAEPPKACKGEDIVVSNFERQMPDRQTQTIPNRLRNASGRIIYLDGVEPEAVPPSCVGGSTCVG